jgi:hypothetical protein
MRERVEREKERGLPPHEVRLSDAPSSLHSSLHRHDLDGCASLKIFRSGLPKDRPCLI